MPHAMPHASMGWHDGILESRYSESGIVLDRTEFPPKDICLIELSGPDPKKPIPVRSELVQTGLRQRYLL